MRIHVNGNCNSYLDSSIHLAYVLLRMLEKWGRQKGDVYVRRRRMRAKNRSKGKGGRGSPSSSSRIPASNITLFF